MKSQRIIQLIIVFLSFNNFSASFAQTSTDTIKILKGVVNDQEGRGLPGVSLENLRTNEKAQTNASGQYSIKGIEGDRLRFYYVGFVSKEVRLSNTNTMNVTLNENKDGLDEVLVTAVSSYSYWSGTQVTYNINSKKSGSNNIVGGSSVIINSISKKYMGARLDVVGNVGNFFSSGTTDEVNEKISKIAQDQSGLSIGLGATWQKLLGSDREFALRPFFLTGYKLNSFAMTVSDSLGKTLADTNRTSLNQWHNSLGIELEGFELTEGGKVHISSAINFDVFDKNEYYKAFNKYRSYLLSLNATVIIPISKKFGFMADAVYSRRFQPVYSFGFIVKNLK